VNRLPIPRLDHLSRLTGEVGVFEHASALVPSKSHVYTADDAARALILTIRWHPQTGLTKRLSTKYLSFLANAIDGHGMVRNRLDVDRGWVGPWSVDAQGRAIWALGVAALQAHTPLARDLAADQLEKIAPLRDPSLRPWIYAGLGAAALLECDRHHLIGIKIANNVADRLPRPKPKGWMWPEPRLRYDNARIPECMLAVGQVTGRDPLVADGLRLLTWLVAMEWSGGHFSFTPAGGRGPGEGPPAFDQQPLEATAMVDACTEAWKVTGEDRWVELAETAALWFVGLNDVGIAIYDPSTGAGHDGLSAGGVNVNAGAESTISALWALQQARMFQREHANAANSANEPGADQ
jgi:hypothetical protein